MKTKIRYIKLTNWFPADDEVATCIARLCILREDLHIDIKGAMEESFKPLDENGTAWRKMYFFRNYIKTMTEILSVINVLQMNKEFRKEFFKSPEEKKEFEKRLSEFNEVRSLIKEYRNAVGGHVLHGAIQKTLDSLTYDDAGIFEAKSDGAFHSKFVMELVFSVLFGSFPKDRQLAEAKTILEKLIPVTPLLLVDHIIAKYVYIRGLLR